MMTDDHLDQILAEAADAEYADRQPRVLEDLSMDTPLGPVTVVEPCMGSTVTVLGGDVIEVRRGYLWHAVLGDYLLRPTAPGAADPDRWAPGVPVLLEGATLLATSRVSAQACRKLAQAAIRRRMNQA